MTDYERNKMEVNVTVSLQEKGGIYQAVLSYKDENDKWKTSWRSTGIRDKRFGTIWGISSNWLERLPCTQ